MPAPTTSSTVAPTMTAPASEQVAAASLAVVRSLIENKKHQKELEEQEKERAAIAVLHSQRQRAREASNPSKAHGTDGVDPKPQVRDVTEIVAGGIERCNDLLRRHTFANCVEERPAFRKRLNDSRYSANDIVSFLKQLPEGPERNAKASEIVQYCCENIENAAVEMPADVRESILHAITTLCGVTAQQFLRLEDKKCKQVLEKQEKVQEETAALHSQRQQAYNTSEISEIRKTSKAHRTDRADSQPQVRDVTGAVANDRERCNNLLRRHTFATCMEKSTFKKRLKEGRYSANDIVSFLMQLPEGPARNEKASEIVQYCCENFENTAVGMPEKVRDSILRAITMLCGVTIQKPLRLTRAASLACLRVLLPDIFKHWLTREEWMRLIVPKLLTLNQRENFCFDQKACEMLCLHFFIDQTQRHIESCFQAEQIRLQPGFGSAQQDTSASPSVEIQAKVTELNKLKQNIVRDLEKKASEQERVWIENSSALSASHKSRKLRKSSSETAPPSEAAPPLETFFKTLTQDVNTVFDCYMNPKKVENAEHADKSPIDQHRHFVILRGLRKILGGVLAVLGLFTPLCSSIFRQAFFSEKTRTRRNLEANLPKIPASLGLRQRG